MPLHFAKGNGIYISDLSVVTAQFQLLSEEARIGPPKIILSGDSRNELGIFILAFSTELTWELFSIAAHSRTSGVCPNAEQSNSKE